MKLLELTEAVGRMEGVLLYAASVEQGVARIRFSVEPTDAGWWSLELLCSLERKYSTKIQVHPGASTGFVEFVLALPEDKCADLQAELMKMLSGN